MNVSMPAFAPWQQRPYDQAAASLDSGRLSHGLLFAGPAALGKFAVAERLAQRMLCVGAGQRPCGSCKSCLLMAAGTHPDLHRISFVLNKEGTRLRTEIVIDQIRQLSEKLNLTPQYGVAQVAIIDPADAINHAACNALLKTLEEPVPGRFLWLVTAHPMRLPATVRSRCQRIEFRLPAVAEAEAWLRATLPNAAKADEALRAARGHPGLARDWLEGEGLALRAEVARDLASLSEGRSAPAEVAQRWTSDGEGALRLRFAAELALETASQGLTDPHATRRLGRWFDHANRTRELLRTTVRADLAVAELLMGWRGGTQRQGGGRKA